MRYYHGGPAGLTELLPPSVTGVTPAVSYLPDEETHRGEHVRTDRVFITSIPNGAVLFAASHPDPWLYEVEPIGEVEHDPDTDAPGFSFQCERAKIIRSRPLTREEAEAGLRAILGTL